VKLAKVRSFVWRLSAREEERTRRDEQCLDRELGDQADAACH
jgi:hypothetical protein